MSATQERFEARLTETLGARAALKTVDAATMQRRRAEVQAAVVEDVVSLDLPADVDADGASSWTRAADADRADPVGGAGRRWRSFALAAAAAAAVLLVAAVGVTRLSGGDAAPAAPTSPAQVWRDYSWLDHDQQPEDLQGVRELGSSVEPDSVRLLARLGGAAYWAGADEDGRLCWAVTSSGGSTGGCSVEPSAPEPLEVADGSGPPALWLVPDGADTSALERRGFIALTPDVWADADALGSARDLFGRLRAAATGDDVLPTEGTSISSLWSDDVIAGSQRLVSTTDRDRYWIAEDTDGDVCLAVLVAEQSAGSSCQAPVVVAGDGVYLSTSGPGGTVTAWLAPDSLDTSGWPALDRVQLAPNLWVDAQTGEEAVLAQLRSAAAGPYLVEPRVGEGSGELGTFVVDGPYSVVVRCIGAAPRAVAVDGVIDHSSSACVDGGLRTISGTSDGSPTTVTVTAAEGERWAAAAVVVVR